MRKIRVGFSVIFLVDEMIQNGYYSILVKLKWSPIHGKNHRPIAENRLAEGAVRLPVGAEENGKDNVPQICFPQ